MTGKKGMALSGGLTGIAIRQDILRQAQVAGLDITEICNRALAGATGIPYTSPGPEPEEPSAPVIVAKDGAAARAAAAVLPSSPDIIHPVINADDPRAASAVKQVQRPAKRTIPAALPGRVPVPEKPKATPPLPASAPRKKERMPARKKPANTGKGQALKQFIAEATIRGETEDDHVTKEALYLAFSRWCREHRITPAPDKKAVTIALKNQFAIKEKSLDGEPAWVNIRLR
ncbi:hypothetical protein [Methanoregula sp.]|uniref:hypothetical protein n=1 Tax=Methanoregula sp. TaxID=2052170 RepID=UPI000CC2D637|nr:hypothetical protein [Methanoregula sp.]PKG32362.1 MAG: hypothetical protein CW742_08560 [Methanoregula sp.]